MMARLAADDTVLGRSTVATYAVITSCKYRQLLQTIDVHRTKKVSNFPESTRHESATNR
jgi:hypothetical protein